MAMYAGRYAESSHSSYNHLHTPRYRPQPANHVSGSILDNILNPSLDGTNLHGPNRQPARRTDQVKSKQAKSQSPLALLIADEERLVQRKEIVARFGATWIRPPGVLKTKQAMDDEEAELREHEALTQREAAMAQERAAQEQAELGPGLDGGRARAAEPAPERDLDDDVPEADTIAEQEFDSELESTLDTAEHSMDLDGGAGDLDDDIPEAGSYEHTDTEVEESSEVDMSDQGPPMRGFTQMPTLEGRPSPMLSARFSASPGSFALDTSAVFSSPTAQRQVQAQAQTRRLEQPPRRNR